MKRLPFVLGLIVVAVLAMSVLIGCGGGGSGGAKEFTVKATEYKFDPANITVTANQKVTVTLQNNGTLAHNWTVLDLDSEVTTGNVEPGQKKSVTFTPTKAGTYKIECTVPGHAEAGMTGTLTVQ